MKKNRTKLAKLAGLALAFICMTAAVAMPVAAETGRVSAGLRVSQSIAYSNGYKPQVTDFDYELTAVSSDAPDFNPDAEENVFQFTLTGEDSMELAFHFDHAGQYQYTLQPKIEAQYPNYTFDRSVYQITAFVENVDSALKVSLVVTDSDGSKLDNISYGHRYAICHIPTTGDDSNVPLWLAGMLVSAGGVIVCVAVGSRRRKCG